MTTTGVAADLLASTAGVVLIVSGVALVPRAVLAWWRGAGSDVSRVHVTLRAVSAPVIVPVLRSWYLLPSTSALPWTSLMDRTTGKSFSPRRVSSLALRLVPAHRVGPRRMELRYEIHRGGVDAGIR